MNLTSDRSAIELAQRYDRISDPQFTHGRDLIDLLAVKPDDQILDIGCGTGRLAAHTLKYLAAGGRIVGIDPEPARIDVAQRFRDPRLSFRLGSAEDLSAFAKPPFDIVYMNSVLKHFPDKQHALAQIRRVLKPGGRLGLTTTVQERPNEQRVLMQRAFAALLEPALAAATGEAHGQLSPTDCVCDPSRGVSTSDVRDLMQGADFRVRVLEVRTYVSAFESAAQIIEFFDVHQRGQLMRGRGPEDAERLRAALDRAVAATLPEERRRGGIRLERYVLLAVADKPA